MRTFGIIGFPLSHSFSQKYFTQKFLEENIDDAVFKNFPIENIEALQDILQSEPGLRGLAVTIPYKKGVFPFLQSVTKEAKAIGACNCFKVNLDKSRMRSENSLSSVN